MRFPGLLFKQKALESPAGDAYNPRGMLSVKQQALSGTMSH
jgi:hypothetical protein